MKISVNVIDSMVSVDGVGRRCVFTSPAGIKAIHWDGEVGFYEGQGDIEYFFEASIMAPYHNAWELAGPESNGNVENSE